VNGPKQGDRERELLRFALKLASERRQAKGSQNKAEEHERNRDMKEKVDDVVSRDVRSAQGIVHRQRKVDHGSSDRPGRGQRRIQDPRDGQEVPDGWVLDDPWDVIKHEGTGKAIVVGDDGRDDDQKHTAQVGALPLANRSLLPWLAGGMCLGDYHFRRCQSKHV